MNTPFRVGSVVGPGDYIEPRKSDLISIAQNIFNGESMAITGDPRIGKTSLLTYISSPNVVRGLNSAYREWKMVFRFMDYHLFQDENFTLREFWQHALYPIYEIFNKDEYPSIRAACQRWSAEASNFALTNLFSAMSSQRIRLVLCIDEFDDILSHPALGTEKFLGALRAIATREPSLVLIISSRLEVNELNERTNRDHRRPGSPFFNHFIQIILGSFSVESANLLIDRAHEVFSERDKSTLLFMAGRHPYFLQIAASALWDQHTLMHEKDSEVRFREVWKRLCLQALSTLDDSWNFWSIRTKQVFAIVALEDMPRLLKTKTFDTKSLEQDLSTCANELMFLELRGYIEKRENRYVLSSYLLLYWLALKLDASIQKNDELGDWLMKEHRGAVLKTKHREKIVEIGKTLARTIDSNKDIFIKALIDSFVN